MSSPKRKCLWSLQANLKTTTTCCLFKSWLKDWLWWLWHHQLTQGWGRFSPAKSPKLTTLRLKSNSFTLCSKPGPITQSARLLYACLLKTTSLHIDWFRGSQWFSWTLLSSSGLAHWSSWLKVLVSSISGLNWLATIRGAFTFRKRWCRF